jgi:phosphoribosyl 1,2-cyclic phosphodiesterase
MDQILVSPFSISHDAADPAGITFEYESHKIGIATDLGIATHLVRTHLKDCSVLYLESNHDPHMLMNGSYPWHLKQRIKGRTGHLSNMDTGELLSELLTDRLEHVILAHLSEENNCPEKAVSEISKYLNGSNISVHVAGPQKPGTLIRI